MRNLRSSANFSIVTSKYHKQKASHMAYKTLSQNQQKARSGTWSRYAQSDRLDFTVPWADISDKIYGLFVECQNCTKRIDISVEEICEKFSSEIEFRKIYNHYKFKFKCKSKICAFLKLQNNTNNKVTVLKKYE